MFFYFIKLLFSGFIPFEGNFVCGQNNSKYRDWAPWGLEWKEIRFDSKWYSDRQLFRLVMAQREVFKRI